MSVAPLRMLSGAERDAVAEQGHALASFLSGDDGGRIRIGASPG